MILYVLKANFFLKNLVFFWWIWISVEKLEWEQATPLLHTMLKTHDLADICFLMQSGWMMMNNKNNHYKGGIWLV